MNANTHLAPSIGKVRVVILLVTLAAVMTTVACSSNSKPVVSSSAPTGGVLRPAAPRTTVPAVEHAAPVAATEKTAAKPSPSKLLTFKSRDYGVSFLYPWQYSILSAKAVANGDSSLRPKSDGHDGQFTLARVEIPRGYYSDSDYESGYFTLSLNPNLNEQECQSTLSPGKDGKAVIDTINGVEFRWVEADSGGRGHAEKLRQYVAFANGTCYELELGVKTSNEGGLAREVDPDQVLRRLDTILRTVKILPAAENPAKVESSTAVSAPVSQN